MKVFLVEDHIYDENHIFSTLDKAKEFCYKLVENCEEGFFEKEMMLFAWHKDCIYVEYDSFDVATIASYELDKD